MSAPDVVVGLPFQSHSETSREAAEFMSKGRAEQDRRRILAALRTWGSFHGLTDEEQQLLLSINPSSQRPRRVELVKLGLVADSGLTRRTRSGRNAVVWTLASALPAPAAPSAAPPAVEAPASARPASSWRCASCRADFVGQADTCERCRGPLCGFCRFASVCCS